MVYKLRFLWRLFILVLLSGKLQALVILQYQHIDLANSSTSIPLATFAAHLGFIEDNNLKVISLAELDKLLQENKALPDKTLVITFDLGSLSLYQKAYPLLKKHGFPFAIFVSPGLQDQHNPELMSWENLQEMSAAGAIIANRGYSGDHLIRKQGNENQAQWQARVLADINNGQRRIAEKTGQHLKFFAYPFGEYSKDLEALLGKEGYTRVGTHPGPTPTYPAGQVLPRFSFGEGSGSEQDFALKVMTLPMAIAQVVVWSENKVPLHEPELPLEVTRPIVKLYMEQPAAKILTCFASGQGTTEQKLDQFGVSSQAKKPFKSGGRNYYHCTVSTDDAARTFWYSQFFITRNSDGSWYSEPP